MPNTDAGHDFRGTLLNLPSYGTSARIGLAGLTECPKCTYPSPILGHQAQSYPLEWLPRRLYAS